MQKEDKFISVPLYLVLSLVTFGLWYLYWIYRQTQILKELDKEGGYSFLFFAALSFLTCGLYTIYYYYKIANSIVKLQRKRKLSVDENLPIVSMILVVFGLPLITTCIHQSKFNDLLK